MDDAVAVCSRERGRQLPTDLYGVVGRQHAMLQARPQALALHVFHDDEGTALVFEDVVDARDVGMRETRHGPRLAQDAGLGFARLAAREALERHLAVETRVVAEEHLTHAARPELFEYLVRSDGRAQHGPPPLLLMS